jgi:hypothetical protein
MEADFDQSYAEALQWLDNEELLELLRMMDYQVHLTPWRVMVLEPPSEVFCKVLIEELLDRGPVMIDVYEAWRDGREWEVI